MLTADTITDEQIKLLWRDAGNDVTGRTLMAALNEPMWGGQAWSVREIHNARARCAEIFNAHNGR